MGKINLSYYQTYLKIYRMVRAQVSLQVYLKVKPHEYVYTRTRSTIMPGGNLHTALCAALREGVNEAVYS